MSEEEKKVTNEEQSADSSQLSGEESKETLAKQETTEAPEIETQESKQEAESSETRADSQAKPVADGTPRAPSKESRDEAAEARKRKGPRGAQQDGKDGRRKHGGKRRRNDEQEQSEFTEKVVQVRRVTKVVKGGKKLSFRVSVIIGNEKGKVGVGVGKASEVLTAIKKAISDAKKSLVDISTVGSTISHPVLGVAGGSKVLLKPAAEGTGIIAGGTARIVLELAGVGDILAKSQGSKSALNVARATVNALGQLRSFQEVANLRGISMKEMLF